MNILALDLAEKTGYAYAGHPSDPIIAGTWILGNKKANAYAKKLRMDRRLDPRVAALVMALESTRRSKSIDWIIYEDIPFASSQAWAHLWGSMRGAIWAFATLNGINVECLGVKELKKFATGSGSADKPAMMAALCREFPGRYRLEKELVKDLKSGTYLDDNAVDALHLLTWAQTILKNP